MYRFGRILLLGAALGLGPAAWSQPGIDPVRFLEHVKYLASEEMRGRGAGTPELEAAADYLAGEFRRLGLQAPGGDFFQKLAVSFNSRLGDDSRVAVRLDGQQRPLRLRSDYLPLSFSGRGRATGNAVFAGYGITAPEYGYDDYAGINARGKIVILLRHEPQEFEQESAFAGKIYTEHAQLFSKLVNARARGARGVILVNDTAQHGGDAGELTEFSPHAGPEPAGVPCVHVHADVVREWFQRAGRDFVEVQEQMNRAMKPGSFTLPGSIELSLKVDVRTESRTVRNVAAYLPGETSEYVIVGAHYDHIGQGEQFSMASSGSRTTHPGADDNASGTAGLLELARLFTGRPRPRRGILFLAFTAEELGLLGSGYYIRHPMLPLDSAVAMVNMDMIGRVRDCKVYVGGAPAGSDLRQVLTRRLADADLDLDFSETIGYGSSDHTAFTARQIPALFFFSGLHGDYHRPSDTWDKVTAQETARLLEYVAAVVWDLAGSG